MEPSRTQDSPVCGPLVHSIVRKGFGLLVVIFAVVRSQSMSSMVSSSSSFVEDGDFISTS